MHKMVIRHMQQVLFALLLCLSFGTFGFASGHPAEKIISDFNGVLLQSMQKADELGFAGRYDLFFEAVPKAFDLKTIVNIAVGRQWRDYSDAQKEKLIALYKEYTAATYASRFKKYSGHNFEVFAAEEKGKRRAAVESTLSKADSDPVVFTYEMRRTGEDWRIIDIRVKGVSRLANTKAQYASILKEEGYEGLVKNIESTIAEIKNENS